MRGNMKEKGNMKLTKLISKHVIIINDSGSNNLYDESNDNKTKIKE